MVKAKSSDRQAFSASDGSDRRVMLSCSWQLVSPRPATLSVSVSCGDDAANPTSLCVDLGQAATGENPVCVWGTISAARAVVRLGCEMVGSLETDLRRQIPNDNPITIDVREILRSMAGRI
jgi:hypothetical protein